MLDCVSVENY